MRIMVVGKSHHSGTSKSGKTYDSTTLMAEFEMRSNSDNSGVCVDRINLNSAVMPYDMVEVGSYYDLDFDRNGYLLGIEKL